jgi:PAS domain S-box-containing protein
MTRNYDRMKTKFSSRGGGEKMETADKQTLRKDSDRIYKVTVSLLSGLMGLILIYASIRLNFSGFRLNFVWSIGFPLLVSLAWGPFYGLISAFFGGTVLYPFILGFSNGWASLVPALSFLLWIYLHGKGTEWRRKERVWLNNLYVIQALHAALRWMLYSTLFPLLFRWNPPFWNPQAVTEISRGIVVLFVMRGILMESVLVAVCDAVLLLPPVRRILRLKSPSSSRYSGRIMAGMVSFGLLFIGFILSIQNGIIEEKRIGEWLMPPDDKTKVTLFLSAILFIIMGGIAVRYFQRALENQESLLKSEKKYMTIFEGIHDLYLETTLGGKVLIASPSVKEILGYEVEELLTKNMEDLYLDPFVREELVELLKEEKEVNNFEVVILGKEGERHYLWLHAKIEEQDGQPKIISVGRDVTNYQKAMDEERTLNQELSKRVEERTKDLQKAVSELESFSYTISHDLKSPLKAIDAYVKMLQEDLADAIKEDPKDMLHQIEKTSTEMIALIDQLLQYSVVSKTQLKMEWIHVREEVLSLFLEQKASCEERNIVLQMEASLPELWADRMLFRQALRNILSNAVKFTKNVEQAVVEVQAENTDKAYILTIRDNGAGFDMEDKDKLFEVLQRLHNREEYEGTGIGLATVKKIMEKHQGEITMEGKKGAGAVVHLIFPQKGERKQ